MARSLSNKTNVNPPDSDYPYGRARDNDGSGNGTPVNEKLIGDVIQFFEHMMNQAGVTHNELPDNDYSGFQYFEALTTYIANRVRNDLQATESLRGSAELATQSEANTGTDDQRIVTPLKLATTPTVVGSVHSVKLFTKVVQIGDWNMDSTSLVSVAHGLADFKKIRSVSVIIRNDSDNAYYELSTHATVAPGSDGVFKGGTTDMGATNITLQRTGSSDNGFFDSTSFDSTSYNRGWITILYEA